MVRMLCEASVELYISAIDCCFSIQSFITIDSIFVAILIGYIKHQNRNNSIKAKGHEIVDMNKNENLQYKSG